MTNRSFLKWAGGKANALTSLWETIPREGDRFVEPFMGSATVSLNADYERYELYDFNADLVYLCRWAAKRPGSLIKKARLLFTPENNTEAAYLRLRMAYNTSQDPKERAVLLLYLNRHGYNGLVRYSKKSGFNVPFGRYPSPYFPEAEILAFHAKLKHAVFRHRSIESLRLCNLDAGTIIYCDPPYLPLSKTASFSQYTEAGFCLKMQATLDRRASNWRDKGAQVFVSNHDAPLLDKVYRRYTEKHCFHVSRTISQDGKNRKPAKEVLLNY